MKNFFKRLFDIVMSMVMLVLLSPFLIIIFIMVKYKLGSPAIFKQERPGLDKNDGNGSKVFTMLKFRTMTDEKDVEGNLLADEKRLTAFGKALRKTSLDELPELWNILKGDMSFVGPRPLLVKYLDRYTTEQSRRHLVRPGLTGWAQVNGRNAISWEEKFKLDLWYVDNWTLWLDFKILFMTVNKVFKREGISSSDSATMEEFMGTPK